MDDNRRKRMSWSPISSWASSDVSTASLPPFLHPVESTLSDSNTVHIQNKQLSMTDFEIIRSSSRLHLTLIATDLSQDSIYEILPVLENVEFLSLCQNPLGNNGTPFTEMD